MNTYITIIDNVLIRIIASNLDLAEYYLLMTYPQAKDYTIHNLIDLLTIQPINDKTNAKLKVTGSPYYLKEETNLSKFHQYNRFVNANSINNKLKLKI